VRPKGVELKNKTLGIVGCGRIGKQVAELALGLGMKVVSYDVVPDHSFAPTENFQHVNREALLDQANFISLHCPPPPDGEPVINRTSIEKMKQGVMIINTARPALLDEAAVLEAIQSNHITGLAVDVFDPKPPVNNELVNNNRVIATPHIGDYSAESSSRAAQAAVENLFNCLA